MLPIHPHKNLLIHIKITVWLHSIFHVNEYKQRTSMFSIFFTCFNISCISGENKLSQKYKYIRAQATHYRANKVFFSANSFVGRENFEVIKKEPIILLFVSKDNGIRYPIRTINLNLYIKIISQLYFKTLRYITTHQQFCF